jgi:endogenous inhibitor of DNA gyrase (YacG/DUF329 family)
MSAQPKRFRCPECKKVVDREYVHGNRKTLESFCSRVGKMVTLTRVIYRKP